MNKDYLIVWICGLVIGFIIAMLLFSSGQSNFEGVADIDLCLKDECIDVGIYRITGYNEINISEVEWRFRLAQLNDAVVSAPEVRTSKQNKHFTKEP